MKILFVQPAPFEPGRLGLENVLWLSEPVDSVLPTKIPREKFYAHYAKWNDATGPGTRKGLYATVLRRPKLFLDGLPGVFRYLKKLRHYRPIMANPFNHLRDEIGVTVRYELKKPFLRLALMKENPLWRAREDSNL